MVVRDAMTDFFASAHINSTLGDTMDKMLGDGLGTLFVVDDKSEVVGSIGERLLMHVVENPELRDELAANFMNCKVSAVRFDDDVTEAARLFREFGVSELPVVDEKKLVGVLTIRQLLRAMTSATRSEKVAFQTI